MGRKARDGTLDGRSREILFYQGDWERLQLYAAMRNVPASVIVRQLVHRLLNKVDARAQAVAQNVESEIANTFDPSVSDESGHPVQQEPTRTD